MVLIPAAPSRRARAGRGYAFFGSKPENSPADGPVTSGPTTQKDGWRVLLTSCPAPPTPKWRNDAVIARCASSGAGIGRDRIPGRRGLCRASRGPLGPAAGVLHIGEGHPRDSMTGFPHDSAVRPRMSVLSGEAPMCRGDRSAHGRASTALSAGAFPHDSANPPPAGPARMCNTARPGPTPHIQVWPRSPRTHFWHRPGLLAPDALPADALPGRPEDAGCQDLPQRPRPSRSAPEETLIFRASARRRSRRRAPLWQIRTRPRPGSPQEPHPPHHSNAPQQRIPARNSDAPPAGRLIRVHRPE